MYVRITRFEPQTGREREVEGIVDNYLEWLKRQPGFLMGSRLAPLHNMEEVARLTIWTDRTHADSTATTEHALSVRSQIISLTNDLTIHEEEFEGDHIIKGLKAKVA
jgi:heme-degrading monooxygenase HmoA